MSLYQRVEGAVCFNLLGKVIDEVAAATVSKSFILPLGCSHGIRLFLDGSRYANLEKSDCCLGWMVAQTKTLEKEEAWLHRSLLGDT